MAVTDIKETSMDIFNKSPRKITCIRSDTDVYGNGGDPDHILVIGEDYTLSSIEVYNWYSLVTLEEHPNQHFNSVLFSEKA